MHNKILLVGGAIVDIMLKIDSLPKKGGNIYALPQKTVVGGCAINIANVLKQFNVDYELCMPLGTGAYSDLIKKDMAIEHSSYKPIFVSKEQDCSYCMCFIEDDGERTFISVEGIEKHFKKEWFDTINFDEYGYFYFSGYDLEGDNGIEILKALHTLPSHVKVVFDAGPRIFFCDKERIDELLAMHPIIHANREEIVNLTGISDPKDAALALSRKTQSLVVATLDKDGCFYANFQNGLSNFVASEQVQQVDATGAGDSHMAGVLVGLSKNLDLDRTCSISNKIAATIVQVVGAKASINNDVIALAKN